MTDDKIWESEEEEEKTPAYMQRMERLLGQKPQKSKDYLYAELLRYEDRVVEYMCKAFKVPTAVRKALTRFVAPEDPRRYTAAAFCEMYPRFPLEFDVALFGKEFTPFTKLGTCLSRFVSSPFVARFMQLQEELPDCERSRGLIFPYSYVTTSDAGKKNPANAVVLHDNYRLDRDQPGFHCVWHPPRDHEIKWPLVLEPLPAFIDSVRPTFDATEVEL